MNETPKQNEEQAAGAAPDCTDLLGCPFCGSAPKFPADDEVFGTCYEAGCEDCGIARIDCQITDMVDDRSGAHASYDNVTHKYGLAYIREVRGKAMRLWNARHHK